MAFRRQADFEAQEALLYRPGQRVELKARPGFVDAIVEYDPMMVPPIWLANDPQPRYPEELILISGLAVMEWFSFPGSGKPQYPACKLSDRQRQKVLV